MQSISEKLATLVGKLGMEFDMEIGRCLELDREIAKMTQLQPQLGVHYIRALRKWNAVVDEILAVKSKQTNVVPNC